MKVVFWILALLGLWEFADIAALFVPNFGPIPAFLWSHIAAGLVLMVAGAGAAMARGAVVQRLAWIAAAAGVWLVLAPFLLGRPENPAGVWNDLIVGALATLLAVWAALNPAKPVSG